MATFQVTSVSYWLHAEGHQRNYGLSRAWATRGACGCQQATLCAFGGFVWKHVVVVSSHLEYATKFSVSILTLAFDNLTWCVLLLLHCPAALSLPCLAALSCRLWPVMASGFSDLYDRGVEQDKGLAENKQRVQEIKTLVHNLRLKLVSRRYRGQYSSTRRGSGQYGSAVQVAGHHSSTVKGKKGRWSVRCVPCKIAFVLSHVQHVPPPRCCAWPLP